MILLKLLLVPAALGLVSVAGKRWGPEVAGLLAGFPIVTGPILLLLALDKGEIFAAQSAIAALSAVFASVTFSVVYSWVCQRRGWALSMLAALFAWLATALSLTLLPSSAWVSLCVALGTLTLAPYVFPRKPESIISSALQYREILYRMLAGMLLTVAVTQFSSLIGPSWSGLFAVFPILGIVLAVSSHRTSGNLFAVSLLSAMVASLYSFVAFCFSLAIVLPALGTPVSFVIAALCAVAGQAVARARMKAKSGSKASRMSQR